MIVYGNDQPVPSWFMIYPVWLIISFWLNQEGGDLQRDHQSVTSLKELFIESRERFHTEAQGLS